jgi:predicted ATPase
LSGVTYGLVRDDLEPGVELRYLGEYHLKGLRYTERIFQLVIPDLPEDFPPLKTLDTSSDELLGSPRHNLPQARGSFVGREHEIAEVERLLDTTRLLTLTGTGGRKTRLALEVARDLVGAYQDGAWLVELAGLNDPMLVPQAVAKALGVHEQPSCTLTDALVDALRAKRMLLVLDNCEHLIDACARLVDIMLTSCPHLQILTTSREALDVAGEASWLVPSLSLPDVGHLPSAEDLSEYEAVRLFVERARSKLPTFELTSENARAVVEICRRLDGIPLAIELAAARVTVLTVEQIVERLNDSLRLLAAGSRTAAPRQQTMRATVQWSYDLLSEQERKLFNRLSVFADGWTLEAAEAVGAGQEVREEEVLDLLGRLVDKSLVVAEVGAESMERYRMLGPIRQYGRERLGESEEAEEVLGRHAALFLALAEQAAPELQGPRQVRWRQRLDEEQDNLRAAMARLLKKGELEKAARLGWALWSFWWSRGHFAEGRRCVEEVLAKGGAMPAASRAKASFVAGAMAGVQGDYRSAEPLLEESLGLFRELGDKRGAAHALGSAGIVAIGQKQHERGIAFFEEAADLHLEVGERWGAAAMLNYLAGAWLNQGDRARAKRLAERGLSLSWEVGNRQGISHALYILAMVAQAERNHEQARGLFEEGLKLSAEVGNDTNVGPYLEGLAALAASEGKVVRAARLWGAAEALFETIEVAASPYAPDRSRYQGQVGAARTQLSEEAFEAAWAEGKSMPPERAVEYALATEEWTSSTGPPKPSPGASRRML